MHTSVHSRTKIRVSPPGIAPFEVTLEQLLALISPTHEVQQAINVNVLSPDLERRRPARFEALDASLQPTNVGSHAYVRDNTTGLTWTAGNVSVERLKWADADQACKALGEGWRLPTRAELLTLVDDTKHAPCIDTRFFPNTKPNWYWTATPAAWSAECAWFVNFSGGSAGSNGRGGGAFVRAVRSPGQ